MKKSFLWVILAGLLFATLTLAACTALPKIGFRNFPASMAAAPAPSQAAPQAASQPAPAEPDPGQPAAQEISLPVQATPRPETLALPETDAAPKSADICPTCPAAPTCPGTSASATPVTATATTAPTSTAVPPTATTAPTNTTAPTSTTVATATAVPPTATSVPPTATSVAATALPTVAERPFSVQANSPSYMTGFAHPELACNWMGIAGQVFSKTGEPLKNIVVIAEGYYNNRAIDEIALTGLSSPYGPGGYEIKLGDKPLASSDSVFLTIFDLDGNPLTYPLNLTTYADCSKNLVIVNFKAR